MYDLLAILTDTLSVIKLKTFSFQVQEYLLLPLDGLNIHRICFPQATAVPISYPTPVEGWVTSATITETRVTLADVGNQNDGLKY